MDWDNLGIYAWEQAIEEVQWADESADADWDWPEDLYED